MFPMRNTRIRLRNLLPIVGLLAVAILLLVFPEHAFGRAGGGGGGVVAAVGGVGTAA
jgi:hypothetical protein